MRFPHLLLSIPVLFAAACSSTPPATNSIESAPATVTIKTNFTKILEVNYRGLLSLSNGQASFKTCETNQVFSVNAKAGLRDIYEQIATTPSTPVYIEFSGEITFANENDRKSTSMMRIDRVHHMALAKSSLQCVKSTQTFRFKAQGDAPYWRLNINNQKLFFATKASNQVYRVTEGNFQTTQINHIKSISDEEQRLNLTIKPGHCYNLKEREYWGYTANVESIWGTFTGCGEPGWPTVEQKFSGFYLNKTATKTTNLTLNDNYTVEYKEQNGLDTIVRSGFWKSNSPDRVVVMLTQQGKHRIREEIVFSRHGLSLNASAINKNNIVTYFDGSGLLFNKMNSQETQQSSHRPVREFTAENINPLAKLDREVQQAVLKYFEIHRTAPENTQFNSIKYDLNGDGIDEAIVVLDWCSKNGCELLIFKGTKDGYHFSSRLSRIHAPIIVAKKQRYLWQSLLTEKNAQWLSIDFDGISYPTDSREFTPLNKQDVRATEVVLFSQGRPTSWFPIKR